MKLSRLPVPAISWIVSLFLFGACSADRNLVAVLTEAEGGGSQGGAAGSSHGGVGGGPLQELALTGGGPPAASGGQSSGGQSSGGQSSGGQSSGGQSSGGASSGGQSSGGQSIGGQSIGGQSVSGAGDGFEIAGGGDQGILLGPGLWPSQDCTCTGGLPQVCGEDNVTYDAICGQNCVRVPIACLHECPCLDNEQGIPAVIMNCLVDSDCGGGRICLHFQSDTGESQVLAACGSPSQ